MPSPTVNRMDESGRRLIYNRVRVQVAYCDGKKIFSAMDDSELFDVFNIDNNPEPEQKTISTQNKKRKAKKQKKAKDDKSTRKQGTSTNDVNGKRFHEDLATKSDVEEDDMEVVSKKPRKV